MVYTEIPPPRPLAHVVRSFWTLEGNDRVKNDLAIRQLPFSCPRFVIHYQNHFHIRVPSGKGERVPTSILNGHTHTYQEYSVNGRFGVVGAYLFPYAPHLLFHLSAPDYFNRLLSLEEVLKPAELQSLENEILNASNNEKRINRMAIFLLDKWKKVQQRAEPVNEMVQHILSGNGNIPVVALSEGSGISLKQLDRKFRLAIGMTPKSFSCLVRFQSTVSRFASPSLKNLTDLALEQGYYDQSHFIHEFRRFAGFSPSSIYYHKSWTVADVICGLAE